MQKSGNLWKCPWYSIYKGLYRKNRHSWRFFFLYQHPTPPLNPLSPPERTLISSLPLDVLVLVSVALCNRQPGCATAPYSRSLCSPFAGGKAVGLTILFPMEKSALPKKRTVGSKPPTAFFVQPMLPWGNAPLRLRMGERAYGDCASPNPCDLP